MNKKKQSKTVNKEAFRMLAIEIGLNAACRKLNVPIPTGKSWARRGGWKLPKRPGGRPQRTIEASSLHPIADALDATHKELADTARTSILQAVANAAKLVAKKPGLDVTTVAQLRDLASALVRLCDNGKPAVTVYSDKTMIVCDEKRRAELIEQRQRLLEAESQGKVIADTVRQHQELNGKRDGEAVGRKTAAAAPVALPAPETHSDVNVGAGNDTVARDQSDGTPQDAVSQHMESIRTATTWKEGEPEHHAGMFGPYPEELE